VVRYDPALKPDAPYQSWGTEYVFVAEDRPDFVALQHILVMRVLENDQPGDAMVVRHWRQEWRYQADSLLAYEGANAWARRAVPPVERSGAWVQSVLQVDDSPRYAARGRWKHEGGVSTWLSDETWRPLPRREFSVRKDYDVLVGTNRHTITPQGWVQEENNVKLVLASGRTLRARVRRRPLRAHPRLRFRPWRDLLPAHRAVLGRSARGVARLEQARGRFGVRAPVDQAQLFMPFFDYAQRLAEGAAFRSRRGAHLCPAHAAGQLPELAAT
jgi:hypothetical protein